MWSSTMSAVLLENREETGYPYAYSLLARTVLWLSLATREAGK